MSRPIRFAALAATAVLVAAGCTGNEEARKSPAPATSAPASAPGAAKPLPASLTGQKLSWKRCSAPSVAEGGGGQAPAALPDGSHWECATLKAPLDYGKPDGKTVGLALIRAKAKDPGHRIGSLVFNFGGPGGSGVATLPSFAKDYEKLRSRYDLVSFDPRGVGDSAEVRCLNDKQLDHSLALDPSPDDAAEVKATLQNSKDYAAACEKNSGTVLPYVGTTSAARDMDLMRQVLGDSKLHYFGISYGTELGGVYAHLYPNKVGRAVLDAVVDPTQDPAQASLGQTKGFQLALNNFLKDCAKDVTCPTGDTPAQGVKSITALLNQLDRKPLPAEGGRKLTESQALTGIAAALYSKDSWPYLKRGLQETKLLHTGNILLLLADSYSGRDQHGHYDNSQAANAAINCVDSRQRYTAADIKAKLPEFRTASPVFGDALAWSLTQCSNWPVAGQWQSVDVSAPGSAPIVVIGNTGDPATPYAGARRMADGLGKGVGIAITYKGQGHGAYDSGNGCVTRTVNGYLLDGKVPSAGTTCS